MAILSRGRSLHKTIERRFTRFTRMGACDHPRCQPPPIATLSQVKLPGFFLVGVQSEVMPLTSLVVGRKPEAHFVAPNAPLGLHASLDRGVEVGRFGSIRVVRLEAPHEPVNEGWRRGATLAVEPAILHASKPIKLPQDGELVESVDAFPQGVPTAMPGATEATLQELTHGQERTPPGVESLAVYLYWITAGTFRP